MTEGPDPSRKTTVRFSIVYLIKAYLGPGCLGLPYAMKQAGLGLGLTMLLVMCALALCNTRALVRCKQRLTAAGTGASSYPQITEHAIGPRGRGQERHRAHETHEARGPHGDHGTHAKQG